MNMDRQSGWSLPLSIILIAIVALAVVLWGFSVLLYVAGLLVPVTILSILFGKVWHSRGCPECQAAKRFVESEHSDWKVWVGSRSHRATELERSIIAVFYRVPGSRSRPDPYVLIEVSLDPDSMQEMAPDVESPYRIQNYK